MPTPYLGRASRRAMTITAYCRARWRRLPGQLAAEQPDTLKVAIGEVDGILAIIDACWVDKTAPRPLPSDSDIDAIMSAMGDHAVEKPPLNRPDLKIAATDAASEAMCPNCRQPLNLCDCRSRLTYE